MKRISLRTHLKKQLAFQVSSWWLFWWKLTSLVVPLSLWKVNNSKNEQSISRHNAYLHMCVCACMRSCACVLFNAVIPQEIQYFICWSEHIKHSNTRLFNETLRKLQPLLGIELHPQRWEPTTLTTALHQSHSLAILYCKLSLNILFFLQWYSDISSSGNVELVASASAPPLVVRAGGYLILAQDQDSFGECVFVCLHFSSIE